jgi:hypothetical protein
MSRFTGSVLLALALLALSGERAAALSFTGQMNAGSGQPNVINMYLTPGGPTVFSTSTPAFVPFAPFPSILLDGGVSWSYYVSTDGYFAQLSTHGSPAGPVQWNQGFTQAGAPSQIAFSVSTQELQWNYATNSGTHVGGSTSNFSGTGGGNPVSAPAGLQGPIPEPSTLLILGLGGLAAAARARRRSAAPAV